MQELGRIYWTRQGLRLAYSALMVWLAVAMMTALMPKGTYVAGTAPSSPAEVLRAMVDNVVATVALPGVAVVVLGIVGAVINASDIRRRDPVRRFTRQQRREGMARAGSQCEMEADSAAAAAARPSTATTSIPGPRAAPPACRTSSLRAPGATAPSVPGFHRRPSSNVWNDDGVTTFRRRPPSVSGNGSRFPRRVLC